MDADLDLFSRRRHSYSISSSEESDGQIATMKLGRLSIGSVKLVKSGLDDLLSTIDGEKHDYDWLLTPPGTPPCAPSSACDTESSFPASRRSSFLSIRSVPATKASRFSVSPADATPTTKPARSSSVTKASSSYLSSTTRSSSLLNTSSNSVTSSRSLSRSSTPTRQNATSGSRPSSPSRTTLTRQLTPSKICNPTSVAGKLQPNQNPRSSTPTARSQMSVNGISPATGSSSRSSTPTRRSPSIASSLVSERSPSVNRSSTPSSPIAGNTNSHISAPSPFLGRASNGRSSAPPSRGSSPGPCSRTSLTEYLDIQPNLKTSLPSRPASVGRTRPSLTTSVRANSEISVAGPTNPSRRSSSPITTKGRYSGVPAKQHINKSMEMHSNGFDTTNNKTRKATASDPPMRRSPKPITVTESMGFGRNISNKSMEMALRHMDIRHGVGNVRPPSGTSLFPQSLRSSTPKGRLAPLSQCSTIPPSNVRISNEGNCTFSNNSIVSGNGTFHQRDSSSELSMLDSFESCRYDMILLNEDSNNTNWLHSLDDRSEKGFVFDHRFEPLPELFDI